MARKRLKRKRLSCKICKPAKTGGSNRWKSKDQMLLDRFERSLKRGHWDRM